MQDLTFDTRQASTLPTHSRATVVVTVLLHVVLLFAMIRIRTHPVRMSPAGTMQSGIAAWVSGPVGMTATSAPKTAVEPKTTIARAAKTAPKEDQSDTAQSASADAAQSAGAAGVPRGSPGGGPVRLGSGGSLTLLNKVTPVYPSIMQSARLPGQVVLDAIIHRDGTIGDVTVLRSTNEAFAQAAIAAVKRWRYTPIPDEGIVTVTVNFTLPR
jgi:TonB family protein